MKTFTQPKLPPVPGEAQKPEDWPELDPVWVKRFNRWYDPDNKAERQRRVDAGSIDEDSTRWYLQFLEAAAHMELVKWCREYPGEPITVKLYGFTLGRVP